MQADVSDQEDLALTPIDASRWWVGWPWEPRPNQAEALPLAVDCVARGGSGLVHMIMGAGKSIFLAALLAVFCRARIVVAAPTLDLVDQLYATFSKLLTGPLPSGVGRFYGDRKEVEPRVIVACNPSLMRLSEELEARGESCDILIVDEAHNSECASMHAAHESLAPRALIGVTATPWRTDEAETLSIFDRMLYSYGPAKALQDEIVVPFRVKPWWGSTSTTIDDASVEMIREEVEQYNRARGVIDAPTIDDAEAFAKRLVEEGFRAAAVHSGISKRERARRIKALQAGDIQILVHVWVFKEGIDVPEIQWIGLRKPTASRTYIVQYVGRGMRACQALGKTEVVLLDPQGLMSRYSLTYEAALGGEWEEPVLSGGSAVAVRGRVNADPKDRFAMQADPLLFLLQQALLALTTLGVASRTTLGDWAFWGDETSAERRRLWAHRCYTSIRAALPHVALVEGAPYALFATLRALLKRWSELSPQTHTDIFDLVMAMRWRPRWPEGATKLLAGHCDVSRKHDPRVVACVRCQTRAEAVWFGQETSPRVAPLVCSACGEHHRDLTSAREQRLFRRVPTPRSRPGVIDMPAFGGEACA